MCKVNIIIRTLNEGQWLHLCLSALARQKYQDFVVTLVDSGSTDNTIAIAMRTWRFPLKILRIDKYTPGKAINLGVDTVHSKYFCCLSAHCVPIDSLWLEKFVSFMDENANTPAVYGRQVPMNFTGPDDKRDLLYTFRGESRPTPEAFFHNANCIVRRQIWELYPFDESVVHIEDMVWAKKITEKGMCLHYLAEASVTHYHGLHQHNEKSSFRAEKLVSVLTEHKLTEELRIEDIADKAEMNILTVVMLGKLENIGSYISSRLQRLNINDDYIIVKDLPGYADDLSLADVLEKCGIYASEKGYCAIRIIDISHEYLDANIINRITKIFYDRFPKAAISCYYDYGNYVIGLSDNIQLVQMENSLKEQKKQIYRIVLGHGTIVNVSELIKNSGEISEGILISNDNPKMLVRSYD